MQRRPMKLCRLIRKAPGDGMRPGKGLRLTTPVKLRAFLDFAGPRLRERMARL